MKMLWRHCQCLAAWAELLVEAKPCESLWNWDIPQWSMHSSMAAFRTILRILRLANSKTPVSLRYQLYAASYISSSTRTSDFGDWLSVKLSSFSSLRLLPYQSIQSIALHTSLQLSQQCTPISSSTLSFLVSQQPLHSTLSWKTMNCVLGQTLATVDAVRLLPTFQSSIHNSYWIICHSLRHVVLWVTQPPLRLRSNGRRMELLPQRQGCDVVNPRSDVFRSSHLFYQHSWFNCYTYKLSSKK
jgi:hypothetical protein